MSLFSWLLPRKTPVLSLEQQQRLLQLIDLLAGHELQGLAPGEIAKALGLNVTTVTREACGPRSWKNALRQLAISFI